MFGLVCHVGAKVAAGHAVPCGVVLPETTTESACGALSGQSFGCFLKWWVSPQNGFSENNGKPYEQMDDLGGKLTI